MELERLERKDIRLIVSCAVVAAVSLFIGVRYFFLAFPEASIEFRTTRESSLPIAQAFLAGNGVDSDGYRHASVFGFDDEAKVFLEREVGVQESGKLLDSTIRLWRWEHRWFRPLQKEEIQVAITTKGEVAGFTHLLPEEAEGADLAAEEARRIAESFLTGAMGRPLDTLVFVEGSLEKRPHRTDHTFTWRLAGSEVKGADYRIAVGIAGDKTASYTEYLKVPDTWKRDYESLRSKNEVTGQFDSVLLLGTAVAMLFLLVKRIIRRDVRWKAAGVLGGVTFALQFISALNQFPADIYGYDTTASFSGFIAQKVFQSLLSAMVFGAVIFLIAAAAEPMYRGRFPGFLSLTSLLRPRAFRTREYFIASLVGITLTCFFFAYENVFYIIANALGAWAPRDVAYSDLLSTAFPWAFVLFIGWFPAISEEFISRMFSIPFFEVLFGRIGALRLPLAMIVSAFIWGFGHAAYPNQPFFIRGLEVGLAGIVFGLVLMRFGIVSVVICHFSVDALYTAFVLIRSPNPYYVITGSLSAGLFAILFIGAAAAYLIKGGFVAPEVTNEMEGAAPDTLPAREEAPGETGAGPTTIEAYVPLSRRMILAGIVLAAAGAGLRLVPAARFGDWVDIRTTRAEAREAAASYLRENGFDVSAYRSAIVPYDRIANGGERAGAAYLLAQGGLDAATRTYKDLVPTPLWRVRFFIPAQHEEYAVSVDPKSGKAIGFSRTLPDDATGASLEKPKALAIAEEFMTSEGLDPAAGELKEQKQEDKKARRDTTLLWEYPIAEAGKAKVRHEVVVQGDTVGSWGREVKVPEEWERDRERTTALTTVLRYLWIPYSGLLAGLAVVMLIIKISERAVPWRFSLMTGASAGLAMLILTAGQLDRLWFQLYQTSVAANLFWATLLIILIVWSVVMMLAGTVVGALVGALYPAATRMFTRAARKVYARDALVAGLVACGIGAGVSALNGMLGAVLPSGRLIDATPYPQTIMASIPFLSLIVSSCYRTLFLASLGGIAVAVVGRYFKSLLLRATLALFFVLSFLPGPAREPMEYVRAALALILVLGGTIVVVRYFLGANPLGWVWCAWLAPGILSASEMIRQGAPAYRWAGWAGLICVLAPGLLLLRDARAGSAVRTET